MRRGNGGGGGKALLAILFVALAVLAACRKPDLSPGEYGGDLETSGTTAPAQNGAGDPHAPNGPGSTTTAAKNGTTTTARSSNTTRPVAPTTTPGQPLHAGARGGAGAFARYMLRPDTSSRIVLEVFKQDGVMPQQRTIDHVVEVLRQVSGKTVTVPPYTTVFMADEYVEEEEIEGLADNAGKAKQGEGQAVFHLLFLRGAYEGDDSILGIAVRGDTAAVFVDQVASAATPIAPRDRLEDAVTMHETGHILGLVDLARDTGRDDPQHQGHSRNEASVMYWAVESSLVGQALNGPPPVNFDSADLADLAALRNGA